MNDLILITSGTRSLPLEKEVYQEFSAIVGETIEETITKYESTNPLILHGDAKGVDMVVNQWCEEHCYDVIKMPYLHRYQKKGGPVRNLCLIQFALGMKRQTPDVPLRLLAFPKTQDNKKGGTWDMIRQAATHGIREGSRRIIELDFSGQEVLF